ncbi:hypothetical protein APP6_1329 [Actinobacillus pleuropneumoniae serovar 6 str. Femo]|nr:hypothetical protein APP6_1329 [Actinobacillus pleuropneumoniae serovar 6 str. Femo]
MSSKDPLLRNTVDGDGKTSIYDYLKEMREIVHYREPFFREPQNDFFENFSSSGEFKEKVKDYFKDYFKDSYNDDMALCFQTPYCLLSAPIFLLNYTNNKLSKFLDKAIILNKEQSDVIKTLILPLGLEQLFKEKCLIY